jgi:hypothetical protein
MSRGLSTRIRTRFVVGSIAYLLVCGSIVFAGAMLKMTDFGSEPRNPPQKGPLPEIIVAKIQLFPDRNDFCRTFFFHNDSGRYQDGGSRQCSIPKDMLVWIRSRREAFAEAFKASWRGETP